MIYGYYNDSVKCHLKEYIEETGVISESRILWTSLMKIFLISWERFGVERELPEKKSETSA